MPLTKKRRQELLDHLVGNCECQEESIFNEDDMETLEKMDDKQLLSFQHEEDSQDDDEESVEETTTTTNKGSTSDKETTTTTVVTNGKEIIFNEDSLPDEVKQDLAYARNMRRQQKDQLIAKITTNTKKDSGFSKKELETMDVDYLAKLADYVRNIEEEEPTPKLHKTPRIGGHKVTNRSEDEKLDDILDLPVMNFGSEQE